MRLLLAIVVVLLAVGGSELATIIAARGLDHGSLGVPWFAYHGYDIYFPWKWVEWIGAFGRTPPKVLRVAEWTAYGVPVVGAAIAAWVSARMKTALPQSTAYGSAGWSSTDDLAAGGLGDEGVVLCQTNDAQYRRRVTPDGVQWVIERLGKLICHNGLEHILCFAPSRSGKGISLVIPSLLSWLHSVLVYDLKGELWRDTAGFRSLFSHCLCFSPADPKSPVRYNPLFAIRRDKRDVRDAWNIAEVCGDPDGSKEYEDHWEKSAKPLLTAAILHLLYAGKRKSLAGVLEFLSAGSADGESQEDVLRTMRDTYHLGKKPHPTVASIASEFLAKSANERTGVFSTVLAALSLYRDPIVAANTDTSDFTIEQLVGLERPVSLYLVVPAEDAKTMRPLVRLLLNQIGMRLTSSADALRTFDQKPSLWMRLKDVFRTIKRALMPKAQRHRLLMLLDEFPTLGRVPFLEVAMGYVAGFGIKLLLIANSLNQLEQRYGSNHSFLDNAHIRMTYWANDERTAKRISDMLGQQTIVRKHVSTSHGSMSLFASSTSESLHEHGHPLLGTEQVMTLPFDDAILMVGGMAPYRAKKVMYYQDPRFTDRMGHPAPRPGAEQRAELPPKPPSVWRYTGPPKRKPAPGAAPPAQPQPEQALFEVDPADEAELEEMFARERAQAEAAASELPL